MDDEIPTRPPSGAIYHCETFYDANDLMPRLEDSLFRYSGLTEFSIEGGHVTSVFLTATFERLDWYWGLFNLCLFADCRFEGCTFRGTAFAGSRFVDCAFVDCRFVRDNLGGECRFDEVKWYGCAQTGCEGLPATVPENADVRRSAHESAG
jgi:uncharacterized protein YjbI with pentapeptide repeats